MAKFKVMTTIVYTCTIDTEKADIEAIAEYKTLLDYVKAEASCVVDYWHT